MKDILVWILKGVSKILSLDGKLPEVFWFNLVINALDTYC